MHTKILEYTKTCPTCVQKSGPGLRTYSINLPKAPMIELFETIAIDILGPLPVQQGGFRYVLTMIDHCTRWIEAIALTNIEAKTCARALNDLRIMRYGPPATVHSDRGSQFTSMVMNNLIHQFGITKTFTTPYHPEGNAILERTHRTLKDRLIVSGKNWLKSLKQAVFDINRTVSATTRNSPMQLVFGRNGIVPKDWPSKKRFKGTVFYNSPKVGDLVAVKVISPRPLQPKFEGRFRVEQRPSPNVAILENGKSINIRRLRKLQS